MSKLKIDASIQEFSKQSDSIIELLCELTNNHTKQMTHSQKKYMRFIIKEHAVAFLLLYQESELKKI